MDLARDGRDADRVEGEAMTAYSFKRRFISPILAGTKPGTIRADRKRHARQGEEVQLYHGMRTKHCQLIARATCRDVRPIIIDIDGGRIEFASGFSLTTIWGLDDFAATDGFADWSDMRCFWEVEHPILPRFSGVYIRWIELRPAMDPIP